jgi:trehalose-phosphatase
MKHLLADKDAIVRVLQEADTVLLLLDYDGTLAPIAAIPDEARPSERCLGVLARLARLPRLEMAIISGRSLDQLDSMLELPGVILVGNHGFEVRLASGEESRFYGLEDLESVRQARDFLETRAMHIEGALVENKGPIVALHYRNVSGENVGKVRGLAAEVRQKFADRLSFSEGKKVFEARPTGGRDKGVASLEILDSFSNAGRLAVFYMGDDTTDEDAFRALSGTGWTVIVGGERSKSSAEYYLESTDEVADFLQLALNVLDRGRKE